MKYKTSIFRKNCLLSVLLATIWLVGCTQEEFESMPPQTGSGVRFTLTVPDVATPSVSSRTMTGTGAAKKEDEIKTVDILVFDASKTPAVFIEWAVGTDIEQNLAGNESTANFSAPLPPTATTTCLVVVANKRLSDIVSGFTKGVTTKAQAMEALLYTQESKWTADGATTGGYMPIPMYGETEVAKIDLSTNPIARINMKRMLARIDIHNSTSNFMVEAVYLANYNTKGFISPAWDENGQMITPVPDIPKVPDNSGKKTEDESAILYSVNGNTPYDGEIYTFESLAAADAGGAAEDGDTNRKDATCLIVKGKIDSGQSTFYRVDFTKAVEPGEEVEYLPLKRNYRYIVTITQALGTGYATIGEAMASYTVMSNLKYRLIHYKRDKVKDVVYNGQYMLGVSKSEVRVTQYQDNNYTIDVFTDSPGGWKATVTEGNDWLTFGGGVAAASGAANDDTQLILKIPYFNNDIIDDSRTATVTLTAGRLTHEIKVTQYVINPGIIKFVDAYGADLLKDGLFFSIRNPDGDNLPIEAQTVYVMFSVDKIEAYLDNDPKPSENIQYNANGIIPNLDRISKVPFSERVQAFTIQPNPGRADDGASLEWRWDHLKFDLHSKDGHLVTVPLTISQGDLEFSLRYYSTTTNSRTYKVYLGAEQYLQLFVNNNWEIMKIEELNITNDDGTGLIRTDPDNDVIIGRSNADTKMYQESVVGLAPDYDDGKGDDVVGRGYDFRLKLHPGKWKEGKKGTIKITFRNVMHTKNDEKFQFYRTIELEMVSELMSYTTVGEPLFHLYPLRFDNRNYFEQDGDNKKSVGRKENVADAEDICGNIGDGWRLPNISELLMSFAYMNALGGGAENYSNHDNQNIYGWYQQDWSGYYWSSSYYEANSRFCLDMSGNRSTKPVAENYYFRCVRDNQNKKYPYLKPESSGVTIVSRDADGGTDTSVLFASGESPDTSDAMNKVAPQLQIENTSVSANSWADAKAICSAKGDNWRLPTQRELFLILSMGGSSASIENQGFGSTMDWGTYYQKIGFVHWTLTARDGGYWLGGSNNGKFDAWAEGASTNWAWCRCVRTVN